MCAEEDERDKAEAAEKAKKEKQKNKKAKQKVGSAVHVCTACVQYRMPHACLVQPQI